MNSSFSVPAHAPDARQSSRSRTFSGRSPLSRNEHTLNTLQKLQQWYQSHCNGGWEQGYGVKIDILAKPGWCVTIELAHTELEGRPFAELKRVEHETEWIHCRVRDGKFEGHGGPFMLEEILRVFLAWATLPPPA